MQNFSESVNKSSLSRLWKKYHEFDSGTISACRGNLSAEENKKRTLELKTYLIKLEYSVTAVKGKYIENYGMKDASEVHEKSFIVFDYKNNGKLKDDLIKLGSKYYQDFITFNSVHAGAYYLIGTNCTGYPGCGKEVKLGQPMFDQQGKFFSDVPGRPFVFENLVNEGYGFDCTMLSYNISTIMCLEKMDGFILSE